MNSSDDEPTQLIPRQPDAPQGSEDRTLVLPPGTLPSAAPEVADSTIHTGTPATLHPLTSPSTSGLPGLPRGSVVGAGGETVRQVGRYMVQSRLGRGGMATVYKALDPSIGRAVAIKFLHASLAEDEECRVRFLREARAAGGLSHPNIVIVHDVGEIEGRPYMAMELIEGQPLSDLLDKQTPLAVRDAVIMGMQLARALGYAHERGIVHRDIKPSNIMVLADGRTVKVADFGIAHMDDGANQRTQVGEVLGTPQYMSPEQTRGEKLDGRSDLFSAGVVLYQMLTGRRPFAGDNLVALAGKIANDAPAPLAKARPDAPASLRRVVDRCLAKRPEQRFQNGKELADALAKVLAEIDEAARERSGPRIVSLRVRWALAMALVVAVVMGITATVVAQRQYAALMDQALQYGSSQARFIARQYADKALNDEWEVIDVALQDMMQTRDFERIVVMDANGTTRAASNAALVGKPYNVAGTELLSRFAGGAHAVRYQASGESVLGFEAPITFQDKLVGRVALGIAEKPLTQVARLSIALMGLLLLVTVLAVAVAMYFLMDWIAKPVKLVSESMAEIGQGLFATRIAETRNDEFGQLFSAFDAMAAALQARLTPAEPVAAMPADPPPEPPLEAKPGG
ncbi:protein kinase domain-containing protein [Roseateles sp.]|uniref:serine/threonine-protein kinase n=1 Tax=Roseateles sp. TaxID=1971397 RepID=UPI0039E9B45B